jgi:hypothetical protein
VAHVWQVRVEEEAEEALGHPGPAQRGVSLGAGPK